MDPRWMRETPIDPDFQMELALEEAQITNARRGLRHAEVPVSYRRRIGVSKISGTLRGTLSASRKILWTLARHAGSRRG